MFEYYYMNARLGFIRFLKQADENMYKNERWTQVQDLPIVASFIGFLYANHNWIWLMLHQDHNQEYKKEDIEIQRLEMSERIQQRTMHRIKIKTHNFFCTQFYFISNWKYSCGFESVCYRSSGVEILSKANKEMAPLQSWQLYNDEAAIWENLNSTLRVKWTTLTALS